MITILGSGLDSESSISQEIRLSESRRIRNTSSLQLCVYIDIRIVNMKFD